MKYFLVKCKCAKKSTLNRRPQLKLNNRDFQKIDGHCST